MSQAQPDDTPSFGAVRRALVFGVPFLTIAAITYKIFGPLIGTNEEENIDPILALAIQRYHDVKSNDQSTPATTQPANPQGLEPTKEPASVSQESTTTSRPPEPTPDTLSEFSFDQKPMRFDIGVKSTANQTEPGAVAETIILDIKKLFRVPQDPDEAVTMYANQLAVGKRTAGTYRILDNEVTSVHSGSTGPFSPEAAEGLRSWLEGGTWSRPSAKLSQEEVRRQVDSLVGSLVQITQENVSHPFRVAAAGNLSHEGLQIIRQERYEELKIELNQPDLKITNPSIQSRIEPSFWDIVTRVEEFSGDSRLSVIHQGGNIILTFCGTGPVYTPNNIHNWGTWSRWVIVLSPVTH